MNVGVVSSRYARALLKFSAGNGDGEEVFSQVVRLEDALQKLPALRKMVGDKVAVTLDVKQKLLRSALGEEKMTPSLEKFLELVVRNGRLDCLHLILFAYINLYLKANNIHLATMVTAFSVPEKLSERIRKALETNLGGKVVIEEKIDPSIIGGTVISVDDWRIDASVSGQLEELGKEFTEMNKRIV